MVNENTQSDIEVMDFDLENIEDLEKLEQHFASQSNYFKPESDVTYKVILMSSKMPSIQKVFKEDTVTKYLAQVEATNAKGIKFAGTWEIGSTIASAFVKGYRESGLKAVYKITKTGSGKETKYNVVKDF